MRLGVLVCFLILSQIFLLACGSVNNWVESASRAPPPTSTTPPSADPETSLPAAPGYAFSSAGATLQGATYKLRFRVGKVETFHTLQGGTYKLRTGKTRHLNDANF